MAVKSVAIIESIRSFLAKNRIKWVSAKQIWPTILYVAIAFRYTRFWPKKHRKLPLLAIAKNKMPEMVGRMQKSAGNPLKKTNAWRIHARAQHEKGHSLKEV